MVPGALQQMPRSYRRWVHNELCAFQVSVGESDLAISAQRALPEVARQALCEVRAELEAYLRRDPEFGLALAPRQALPGAPAIVQGMAEAARVCGVGPMAAVAGAIAQHVGEALRAHSREVIVENGGDIFLHTARPRTGALYAGCSPLSGRVGVRLNLLHRPLGLCTSSGTVGPSLSFGRADAALVLATSGALADAAATALGNQVKAEADIPLALECLQAVEGLLGGVVVLGEHLGAWGEFELVPIAVDGG